MDETIDRMYHLALRLDRIIVDMQIRRARIAARDKKNSTHK